MSGQPDALTLGAGVRTQGLTKAYGEHVAVRDISVVVPSRTIVALIGPNGAGKTTFVRMLSTLTSPSSGRAVVAGCDVRGDRDAVKRSIGVVGQSSTVDGELTVSENLALVARLLRVPEKSRLPQLLDALGLHDVGDLRAGLLSGGMRRRLDLALSLVGSPSVLLLDEPTTGLDPDSKHAFWGLLRTLRSEGATVVLTTQDLDEAETIADTILVLSQSRVIAAGSPSELKRRIASMSVTFGFGAEEPARRAAELFKEQSAADRIHVVGTEARLFVNSVVQARDALNLVLDNEAGVDSLRVTEPTLYDAFAMLTASNGAGGPSDGLHEARAADLVAPVATRDSRRARFAAAGKSLEAMRVLSGRNLRKLVRTPRYLVMSTLQPAFFLGLFGFVISRVATVGTMDYVQFVVPAVLVQALILGAMATSMGMAIDNLFGMTERFRTLPISSMAMFGGRAMTGVVRVLAQTLVLLPVSLVVGFRFEGSIWHVLGLCILLALIAAAFSSLACAIGLSSNNIEMIGLVTTLPVLPLLFLSSALTPIETLPPFLRWLSEENPVTAMVNVARFSLAGEAPGWRGSGDVVRVVVSSLTILAGSVAFARLAVGRRERTT